MKNGQDEDAGRDRVERLQVDTVRQGGEQRLPLHGIVGKRARKCRNDIRDHYRGTLSDRPQASNTAPPLRYRPQPVKLFAMTTLHVAAGVLLSAFTATGIGQGQGTQ